MQVLLILEIENFIVQMSAEFYYQIILKQIQQLQKV